MSKLIFTDDGWKDYLYWQTQDKKTLKKINKLLKDIQRDPFSGEGKQEPLKMRRGTGAVGTMKRTGSYTG